MFDLSDELEMRRRRAAWRAAHRGTKELDLLIGRYAEARLQAMGAGELAEFERFLMVEETDLQAWLLAPCPEVEGEFAGLVAQMRAFHGLE